MDEKLEKIETFFSLDLKIKKEIMDLKQDYAYQLTGDYLEKYIKEIYTTINDMEENFIKIANDFNFGNIISSLIRNKFNKYRERLFNAGYDYSKIKAFYEQNIYELSEEIVLNTKDEILGYSIINNNNFLSLLNRSKTINEMLHIIHYYIINNDNIYKSMPKISSKINNLKKYINLYGKENTLAYNLFAYFPNDLFVGTTDIISLNNRLLMMIRDVGHATVFEIEEYNDKINVQYYIPKICNVDMVNNLRGINKVTDNDKSTSGFFITDRVNFFNDIFDTISKIPNDSDMEFNFKNR